MIAIKGMEKMPETCSDCDMCHGHVCKVTGNDIVAIPKDGCPLARIVTCEYCNNHGISKEHPDIDGARYCSALHTYTGYDFYCGDAERRE